MSDPETKKRKLDANGVKSEEPPTEPPTVGLGPNGVQEAPQNGTSAALRRANVVVPAVDPQLFYTPLKTGLVYDVRMRYHAKIFTSYFEYIDPHPEDPRRIYRIYKRLAEAGLIQDTALSGADDIGPLMTKIPVREATVEEILEVHSEAHWNFLQLTEKMLRQQLLDETDRGDSIYVNNDSFLLAKLSCGGSIEACRAVIEGRVKNLLAIVRPPGHHAEPDLPAGFCLFLNVAVAAKNVLKAYPELVRKIVILDWDIHHGNGTQKAFYDDPRVLYISLHRYENGKFYPGTKYGLHTQSGEGAGEGFSLNIPWRNSGMGDADYMYAFTRLVIPVITEFDPDLVIVSSGFDAADGDIIGGCHVTPAGYGYMTHQLKALAKGKLAVVLEGGYNLDSISKSALAVAKVLVGEPPEKIVPLDPHLETLEVVDEVVKYHSKYWRCLRPGNPNAAFDDVYDLAPLSAYKLTTVADPIRAHQAHSLFQKHGFVGLPVLAQADDKQVFSTGLPAAVDDLIVASHDIHNAHTAIIAVHDPPEIWANINPVNGNIEGGLSVVLEHPLSQVMDKVRTELGDTNVGYIDVNIPSFALAFPSLGGNPTVSTYNPTVFAQELVLYLWDNYLTYFSHLKKVVFVGFGDAYQAIVHLYAKRLSLEIKELVQGTVVFVSRSPLKPLVPVMDELMIDWYYQNSVVFTSCLNPCWSGGPSSGPRNGTNGSAAETADESSKRPRRKFGRVLKATSDGLWDVISERFDEGVDFILDSIEEYSGESN